MRVARDASSLLLERDPRGALDFIFYVARKELLNIFCSRLH